MGLAPTKGGGYNPVRALGADLLEYWDASDSARLTLNGSEVVTWASGKSGLAPTQATQTARPLYNATAFNGAPCVVFDGVDDQLTVLSTGNMPIGSSPCEIWVVGSQDTPGSDAASRSFFGYGNGGANAHRTVSRARVTNPSSFARTIVGETPTQVTGGIVDMSGPFVMRSRMAADQVTQWLNGVLDGSAALTLSGTTNTRTRIGAFPNSAGSQFFLGKIAAIFVTNLLNGKEAAFQSYLMERAGFSGS